MKLEECYIGAFGCLEGFSLHFQGGLQTLCLENGTGKSTLVAFLRAMLYGMPGGNRKNLLDAERRKYAPWNGHRMEGMIVFSQEGRRYRLERTFGQREKEDTVRLTDADTGLVSEDFPENPGYALFGIGREAFSATILQLQEAGREAGSAEGIPVDDTLRARLGNSEELDADLRHFGTADRILENNLKEYKRTGERGRFYDLQRRQTQLEVLLRDTEREQEEPQAEALRQKREDLLQYFSGRQPSEEEQDAILHWWNRYLHIQEKRHRQLEEQARQVQEDAIYGDWDEKEEEEERKRHLRRQNRQHRRRKSLVWLAIFSGLTAAGLYVWSGAVTLPMLLCAAVCLLSVATLAVSAGAGYAVRREEGQNADNRQPEPEVQMLRQEEECFAALWKLLRPYFPEGTDPSELTPQDYAEQMREMEQKRMELQMTQKQAEQLRTAQELRHRQQQETRRKLEQELADCRRQLQQAGSRADDLALARSFLAKARQDYSVEYRGLIQDGMQRYLESFSEEMAQKAEMDACFSLGLRERGHLRELDYYSRGNRDVLLFCERLALADAVFNGNIPLLILDDPFSSLDDRSLEEALTLLVRMGEHNQILYLTCQTARMP